MKVAGHPAELFDRQNDPEQVHNVAGSPDHREAIEELESELQRQIAEVDIAQEMLSGNRGRNSAGKQSASRK